jgi:hypothetical protein
MKSNILFTVVELIDVKNFQRTRAV